MRDRITSPSDSDRDSAGGASPVSTAPARAPSKFRAIPTYVDGIRFASKKEAARYNELKLLERAGEISRLELQPRFDITVNGVKCGFYKADYRYFQGNAWRVEDCKGFRTPLYKFKKKLVEALYPGVIIREV